MPKPRTTFFVDSRLILLAGFGGLLVLMAFAEFDGVRALRSIQTSNDAIREDFLRRTRVLERIRADLYVSGTYVRDYLLEPENGRAEGHRHSLLETRTDMDAAVSEYGAMPSPRESSMFQDLTRQLATYWQVLEPVLQWDAAQRRRKGYQFLEDEVFPRRTAILQIANSIGAINEAQLDAGRLRAQQTFSQYRRRLGIVIAMTIGLGLLLAAFSVRRILALETRAARHYREISKAQAELRRLSASLVEAQENERRSISRELHDEVGQALSGVLLEMASLSQLVQRRDAGALDKVEEIKKEVENTLGAARDMALLLRPSMLDDLGLVPALEWQAREVGKRSGVRVRVAAEGVSEDLPEQHKTCIYRAVQEALHNCVRHAGARDATITVRQEPERLSLSVEDNGKGFDPLRQRGLGLIGMQERVSGLGGVFRVESVSGRGTTVRISLPLAAPGALDRETA
ncbi:MAG: ATP-binding protein [Bryobacteraceae bacterium]|jgi:signal transduction histidine kinase